MGPVHLRSELSIQLPLSSAELRSESYSVSSREAASQTDALVASPSTPLETLQWRVEGVYTAPHANETTCDQSLALELKNIPSLEKKEEEALSLFLRVRAEGSCKIEEKGRTMWHFP